MTRAERTLAEQAFPGPLPGDDDPVCRALGITTVRQAPGRAELAMPVTGEMVNRHGTVHGGYLFLLADAAFADACNSRGPAAVAQHAQITFLRPVAAGGTLRAEATERARYGRFGVYDVTVRQPDGTVVAELRGHSVALAGLAAAGNPVTRTGSVDDGGADGH